MKLVYCAKCGTQNEDDVAYCISCGVNLNVKRRERPQNYDNMCFGKREGNNQVGWIIFGLIVIIVGISLILDQTFDIQVEVWPFVVLIIGALIVISAIMNRRSIDRRNV